MGEVTAHPARAVRTARGYASAARRCAALALHRASGHCAIEAIEAVNAPTACAATEDQRAKRCGRFVKLERGGDWLTPPHRVCGARVAADLSLLGRGEPAPARLQRSASPTRRQRAGPAHVRGQRGVICVSPSEMDRRSLHDLGRVHRARMWRCRRRQRWSESCCGSPKPAERQLSRGKGTL